MNAEAVKRMIGRKNLFYSIILLLCTLFACGRGDVSPLPAEQTPEATAIRQVSVQVSTPEPTATAEPTFTPKPTKTPEPTATAEPTFTPEPFELLPIPVTLRATGGFKRTSHLGTLFNEQEGIYAAYGKFGNGEAAFYISDKDGNVSSGTEPFLRICAVPAYTPEELPSEDDSWMLAVYLPSQSVVAFHSEQGEWIEKRVMICSTGRKGHDTPAGRYKIYERYEYKLLGTDESPCYGFWACRFKGHYLFHSVPINADAGRDTEKAHRMTTMRKYEKLGTVASDGCIRLTVEDAKWIYDLSEGRNVEVWVTKTEGPVPPKPPAIIWEEPYTDKKGLGWDPTDPHPDNPYQKNEAEDTGEQETGGPADS